MKHGLEARTTLGRYGIVSIEVHERDAYATSIGCEKRASRPPHQREIGRRWRCAVVWVWGILAGVLGVINGR